MQKPIFYDPTGRRRKATLFGMIGLIATAAILFVGLILSIVIVPVPSGLDLHMEYPRPSSSKLTNVGKASLEVMSRRQHAYPLQQIAAFYVPWDDASRNSLRQHIASLDIVVPALATVTGPNHAFAYTPDYRFQQVMANAPRRPEVLTMVQNSGGDNFDGANLAALLHTPEARARLLNQVVAMLQQERSNGVTFDFESLPQTSLNDYLTFLREARHRLAPGGYLVALAAPVDDDTWNLRAFAAAADKIFLMAYDQHSMVDSAGPIAEQDWFNVRVSRALRQVPVGKAIICIGNYAYDWSKGRADSLTVEEAWLIAHDSDAQIQFDPVAGNASFAYEEDGVSHQVWMLDAVSAWNQLRTANAVGASGVALWRLGSEDPVIWQAFQTYQGQSTPDLGRLQSLGNVDVSGNGEVIHIDDTPTEGRRVVTFDARRVAQAERFLSLPTPYAVRRAGYHPDELALTFDDGPDAQWTPQILKILKQEHVPATFFVIGEKAISHPSLLRQMVRDGHEIGNHSYTHPNLATVPPEWVRFELNSTQRVVEAYTERSMRLMRAPYFGDAEPTTEDELGPALIGQDLGYTNVGLHVDSEDWTRPGVAAIIKNTLDGVHDGKTSESSADCLHDSSDCRSGQIILMHDAGGDRSQTLAALPTIIRSLKAEGYRFVLVGDLVGLPRDQVMPQVKGSDLAEVQFDVGAFITLATAMAGLKWLFFGAILLGIARAILLSALAVYAEYRDRMQPPGEEGEAFAGQSFVSVIIPAFNEARVIESSVRRVLLSQGVAFEIIVVDDGSSDGTSPLVSQAFADEPRVRLITQANVGKAAAVNNGIEAAKGDIIIALDADTQFEPETIARLVRWFVRPDIAAVAGNAKVGNRFNWVTRWQAVEYVTAQNLERSALATFGAMMVVPGAVGAWRRSALTEAGGYPHNTLAEDQDLTISVQRLGWKVAYDQEAVAWTEAPESFGALMKQRYRWAFGTLQCLWKHRQIVGMGKPRGLAYIGIPQAWVFQIGFSLISPIIDLALVVNIIATVVRVYQHGWAQSETDLGRMLVYWVTFLAVDAICGAIAYWLEPREKSYPMFWLLSQRFVYRQIMYYVVIKALFSAGRGMAVGWGKLERSGRSEASSTPEPTGNL